VAPAAASPADDERAKLVRRALQAGIATRQRALSALRSKADAATLPLIAAGLPQAQPAVAVVFLEILGERGDERFTPTIHSRLRDPDPTVRAAAFEAAGLVGSAADSATLMPLVAKEQLSNVQADGVRALGRLGGPGVDATLAALLASDETTVPVQEAAAWAVGACRCVAAQDALLKVLGSDPDGDVLAAAAESAGRLATPEALVALRHLASQKGTVPVRGNLTSRRLLGLRGLCSAGDEAAGPELSAFMMNAGMSATSTDVDVIARTGDAAPLLPLLAHPHGAVRRRSAELLSRLVASAEEATAAVEAIEHALVEEGDTATLTALHVAAQKLRALSQAERRNDSTVSP
jgi:HEAT repeat protein